MKSTFRATAILSGGSITSILLSLISAKVMAVYLHPAGYGYYGLLQSFLGLIVLLSGMGIATGLVRSGAGPAARNDEVAVASLRRGAWLLFMATGSIVTVLLFLFLCFVFMSFFGGWNDNLYCTVASVSEMSQLTK